MLCVRKVKQQVMECLPAMQPENGLLSVDAKKFAHAQIRVVQATPPDIEQVFQETIQKASDVQADLTRMCDAISLFAGLSANEAFRVLLREVNEVLNKLQSSSVDNEVTHKGAHIPASVVYNPTTKAIAIVDFQGCTISGNTWKMCCLDFLSERAVKVEFDVPVRVWKFSSVKDMLKAARRRVSSSICLPEQSGCQESSSTSPQGVDSGTRHSASASFMTKKDSIAE